MTVSLTAKIERRAIRSRERKRNLWPRLGQYDASECRLLRLPWAARPHEEATNDATARPQPG